MSRKRKKHHDQDEPAGSDSERPPFQYDKVDHKTIRRVLPFLEGLYKYYFRCEVKGWENVPKENALFVGNHNGLITFEVLMLFYAWWAQFGPAKRALGLAHAIAVDNPLFKWLIPKLGGIPARPDIAEEALNHGYSLLVFPGGEKEAFRSYRERKVVDFYQRKGFIRLALKTGRPIVPIACVGGQESYIILHRGEEIAEALGLKKKLRLHGLPVTFRSLFFLWCLASGFVFFVPWILVPGAFASIFVPLPVKMTFEILPPIDVSSMVDPNLSEDENQQRIYNHVLSMIQQKVSEHYDRRNVPVLGSFP